MTLCPLSRNTGCDQAVLEMPLVNSSTRRTGEFVRRESAYCRDGSRRMNSSVLQGNLPVCRKFTYFISVVFMLLAGCEQRVEEKSATVASTAVSVARMGWLSSMEINEASGLQASFANAGSYFVHNDEGQPLVYVINEAGKTLGTVLIVPAKNLDWEDITSVPVEGDRWIVAGDIGDNLTLRRSVKLYFVEEPRPGEKSRFPDHQLLQHSVSLTYPDGPRDCESMAYDPIGDRILLLSKRDKPPRLYAVSLATALSKTEAELEFLGEISPLRPPTFADRATWRGRTDWISQPTGMDISADGTEAVIVTYRSLYHYHRLEGEDWLNALQKKPQEVPGPPGEQNEAITFSTDGGFVFVMSEQLPTALYRLQFKPPGK